MPRIGEIGGQAISPAPPQGPMGFPGSPGPSGPAGATGPPISYLAYSEITGTVTISGTSQGSPTDTGLSITFTADGSTHYNIDFYTAFLRSLANGLLFVDLWLDSSVLAHLALLGGGSHADMYYPGGTFRKRVLPSSGSHTWQVKAYRSTANGEVGAGTGASGDYAPAFLAASAT